MSSRCAGSWGGSWSVESAALSEVGPTRTSNQDRARVDNALGLFALADGMGGHRAGERASTVAMETVFAYLGRLQREGGEPSSGAFCDAILSANSSILADAAANEAHRGMGTTFTGLLLCGEQFCIGHVGDSRAWRVREGRIERLTQDHSLVGEQLRQGIINSEEAQNHPMRNVLMRCLGKDTHLEVDLPVGQVRSGDLFVLASDGLVNGIDEDAMLAAIGDAEDLNGGCRRLVAIACEAYGRDNTTAVLVRCSQ